MVETIIWFIVSVPVLSVLIALVAPEGLDVGQVLDHGLGVGELLGAHREQPRHERRHARRDRRDRHRRAEQQQLAERHAPRATPTTTMNATAPHAMTPRTLVSESSSFCSGDRVRVTEVSIVAICPICVSMPVAVTTIAAVPRVTEVFWNSMFARSPSAMSAPASTPASLATGALSPVSAASWVSSVADWTIRPSAGHDVAGLELDDVAGDDLDRRHERDRAVAHHLRLRHLQFRKRIDARARLQLLPRAEHDVQQDQQRHDQPRRDLADREAHRHDGHQHDVHRVAQLPQRHPPDRGRRLPQDFVSPRLRQARRCHVACQSGRCVRAHREQDVLNVSEIGGSVSQSDRSLVSIHSAFPRRGIRRIPPLTAGTPYRGPATDQSVPASCGESMTMMPQPRESVFPSREPSKRFRPLSSLAVA